MTDQTVGLSTYVGMPKPESTYGSSGNLAETTLVVIEAELQVIIKHHNRSHSQNSVGLYVTW